MNRPRITAPTPTTVAVLTAIAVTAATFGWYFISALLPVDYPMRWFVVFAVPVAASLGLARWASATFPWGRWITAWFLAWMSIPAYTPVVIAGAAAVLCWPAARALGARLGAPRVDAVEDRTRPHHTKAKAGTTRATEKTGPSR